MNYIVKVTVATSRDPECNPFSLTQFKEFGIELPQPEQVKQFIRDVRADFMVSYPSGQGKPSSDCLLPTDVVAYDAHSDCQVAAVNAS